MNKIIASLALVAAISGQAFAAEVTTSGTAQNVAKLGTASGPITFGATELINAETAMASTGTFKTVTFPSTLVNYAANVGIKSGNGALTCPTCTAAGGFATKVNYKAEITPAFGGADPFFQTNGSTDDAEGVDQSNELTGGAVIGTLTLKVTIGATAGANPDPIVAGAYGDTITVVVGATV